MNMHEVRGWDMKFAVKTQLKVTHAPKMTSDLMPTNRDLITACRHKFQTVLIF